MDNEQLKAKYDEMHAQGVTSWFSDGREERETILKLGEPWSYQICTLEIGCGEGQLANMICLQDGGFIDAIDYSEEAIKTAKSKYFSPMFIRCGYRDFNGKYDRLIMQGVLEHLDDPFGELEWMISHFKPKTVITSSPCFLNPRGIVWMTLHMLGAVMSKTDLHFLHPWQFVEFCTKHGYTLSMVDCDWSWGNHEAMVQDLTERIPLALEDGNLPTHVGVTPFLMWLERFTAFTRLATSDVTYGATMVYRIDIP